jgi:hypothetical protein
MDGDERKSKDICSAVSCFSFHLSFLVSTSPVFSDPQGRSLNSHFLSGGTTDRGFYAEQGLGLFSSYRTTDLQVDCSLSLFFFCLVFLPSLALLSY